MKYKKILFINAESLPIPAVKGGAVESLLDSLLIFNEENKFADLYVASPYDVEAEKTSKKYLNTSFFYIKNDLLTYFYKIHDDICKKYFRYSSGIRYIHKICSLIRKNSFDLIVVENRPLFGHLIRKVYKGELYLHLHNDYVNVGNKFLDGILVCFNKIIAVSNYIGKRVQETGYDNVKVVYNGININLYKNSNTKYQLPKRILYVGRIVEEKGILDLIQAFSMIKNNKCQLDIIGGFDDSVYQKKEFKYLFLKSIENITNINYLGYVPNTELKEYFNGAYCGVIPSKVDEGFALTSIEMMTAGLPVIVTSYGALPELIDENVGMIVNKDNLINNLYLSLVKLIDNEKIRNIKSKACIEKANSFNMRNYINNMKKELLE